MFILFIETNMKLNRVTPEFGVSHHPMQMGIKLPKIQTFKQNAQNDIQQLREIVYIIHIQ